MSEIKNSISKGVAWSGISQIGLQISGFVISIILARLLTPADFGLVGMVVIFTGFAGIFSELGYGAALIQNQSVEERHYSSIFWLSLATGIILTALLIFASPWIADFYNEKRLVLLTKLIAINFSIGALNIVQQARLTKELAFKKLAYIEITATIIAGAVATYFALMGIGVYALVWQMLMRTFISVVLMWISTNWIPKLIFDRKAVMELFRFSANLLGFQVFNYWIRNTDNLLIGKFIGTAGLGVYSRAYSLMLLPITQISRAINRVMFPAMSKIQNDKPWVKSIFLRTISSIALISFPMMLGLLVVADKFILTLYGQKWAEVIPILQILCIVGLFQSIANPVGVIYNSQGRTDWQLWWGIFSGILTIIAFAIGLKWGVIGVATAYSIRVYSTSYLVFAIPGKLIGMSPYDVLQNVVGILGCSICMALAVWALGFILGTTCPDWAYLAAQIPFGVVVYFLLIHSFRLKAYMELKLLLREQWQLKFAKAS